MNEFISIHANPVYTLVHCVQGSMSGLYYVCLIIQRFAETDNEKKKTLYGEVDLGSRCINNLPYANDIVLIATSLQQSNDIILQEVKAENKSDIYMSIQRTKIMTRPTVDDAFLVYIDGNSLEQYTVSRFSYLVSSITSMEDLSGKNWKYTIYTKELEKKSVCIQNDDIS